MMEQMSLPTEIKKYPKPELPAFGVRKVVATCHETPEIVLRSATISGIPWSNRACFWQPKRFPTLTPLRRQVTNSRTTARTSSAVGRSSAFGYWGALLWHVLLSVGEFSPAFSVLLLLFLVGLLLLLLVGVLVVCWLCWTIAMMVQPMMVEPSWCWFDWCVFFCCCLGCCLVLLSGVVVWCCCLWYCFCCHIFVVFVAW